MRTHTCQPSNTFRICSLSSRPSLVAVMFQSDFTFRICSQYSRRSAVAVMFQSDVTSRRVSHVLRGYHITVGILFISIYGTLYNKGAISGASGTTCLPPGQNNLRTLSTFGKFAIMNLFASSIDICAVNCNTYSNLIYLEIFIYLHIAKLCR